MSRLIPHKTAVRNRRRPSLKILRLFLLFSFMATSLISRACDLCGCYTPQLEAMSGMEPQSSKSWWNGFYGAVGEQFTHFGTVLVDGREVANPTGQYENSSITQLVAGYQINSRFALQISVPLIYREFKRPEGFAIDRGTVSGLGDVSLLLRTVLFHYASPGRRTFQFEDKTVVAIDLEPDFTASAILLTGIKFPTGDSSRLEEEFHEIEIPGAPVSGIHGHDLTLGTGSYDGIFGEQFSLRYRNIFLESNVQFTLRGDGAHQYHFANDLVWNGGPRFFFFRNREINFGLQIELAGENKDVDCFCGKPPDDTGGQSSFLVPTSVLSR